jgi:hypothetical protein
MDTSKGIIYAVSGLFAVSCLFCIISLSYTSLENVSAKSLDEKITQRKTELEQVTKKAASLSEWLHIKAYFKRFRDNYFMKMDEFSRFRDELQMKLNQYGLNTQNIGYKYKRIFKDYIQVEVNFTAIGAYPNIKRFMHEIAGQKKMILIKRIQMSRTDRGDIGVKILMEVYLVS